MKLFLTAILMQVQAAAEVADAFSWQRLFDVGLSLGILAVIANVLWKRLKALEDKMQTYLDQDRKEMMDVIKNNTSAFEKLNDNLDKIH